MLGLILSALATLAAVTALSSATTQVNPTPAPVWSGRIGGLTVTVKRNGADWAWYVEAVGAGAERLAVDALTAALRTAIESGKLAATDGVGLQNATASVIASVRHTDIDSTPQVWESELIAANAQGYDERNAVEHATRGQAILGMIDALRPFMV